VSAVHCVALQIPQFTGVGNSPALSLTGPSTPPPPDAEDPAEWSIDPQLKYCYNWLDRERYTIESKEPLPAGKAIVKFEFKYDGGGLGKGGAGTLYVNDQNVGEGRIDKTQPTGSSNPPLSSKQSLRTGGLHGRRRKSKNEPPSRWRLLLLYTLKKGTSLGTVNTDYGAVGGKRRLAMREEPVTGNFRV
jgi:hypothetical protein